MAKQNNKSPIFIFAFIVGILIFLIKGAFQYSQNFESRKSKSDLSKIKRTRRISLALIFIGLIPQLSSLFVTQSDASPALQSFFAPHYADSLIGIDDLFKNKHLAFGDKGFNELSEIGIELIKNESQFVDYPDRTVVTNDLRISLIELDSKVGFGEKSRNGFERSLRFLIASNLGKKGITYEAPITEIQNRIEHRKRETLFYWSIFIFVCGFFIQIFGIYIKPS